MKIEHLEKYSKRALIRAYLCAHSEGQSGCPAGGGEHCKMMKGCRKVTPADWWNDDVLPEYKDFQISGLNTDTTLLWQTQLRQKLLHQRTQHTSSQPATPCRGWLKWCSVLQIRQAEMLFFWDMGVGWKLHAKI